MDVGAKPLVSSTSEVNDSALVPIANPSPIVKHSPAKINWPFLTKYAKSIKYFLRSLDILAIGKGLMWYDEEKFLLRPRSNWFDNHTYQWIVNIGNPQATFDKTQGALIELNSRIKMIRKNIDVFKYQPENHAAAHTFLMEMIKVRLVIEGVAIHGLKRLSENYAKASKTEQSASVANLGSEAFSAVASLVEKLKEKMEPFVEGLSLAIDLEKYGHTAKELLGRREIYAETLSKVLADQARGLIIPLDLIKQCLSDCSCKEKPAKEALKNAMRLVGISNLAIPLSTQCKTMFWQPKRLVIEGDKIEIQQGVWGTSERTAYGADNICNLHYRINPLTKHIIISGGSLNSQTKAGQLAVIMGETLKLVPEANNRWVVHQLNSQSKERRLIDDVHSNIYLNEKMFASCLGKEMSFLHFNTCLNAATMFAYEDSQSRPVNYPSLAKLVDFILTDLQTLLKGKSVSEVLFADGPDSFKKQSEAVVRLAEEVKLLELQMKDVEEGDKIKLDKMASLDNLMAVMKENELTAKLEPSEEILVFESDEKGVKSEAALQSERNEIEGTLPGKVKELTAKLQLKQSALVKSLPLLKTALGAAIAQLVNAKQTDPSPELEKALLILQVYEKIFILQLKQPVLPL